MKAVIRSVAILLPLILFADGASFTCKVKPGSLVSYLSFVSKQQDPTFDCVTKSSNKGRSKGRYARLFERLRKDENEISETKSELSELKRMLQDANLITTTAGPDPTSTRTQPKTTRSTTTGTTLPSTATWKVSGNYRYKYFRHEHVSYTDARERCKSHGARLAAEVIRHPDVLSDIIEAGFLHSRTFSSWLWIGFNDRAVEGVWNWADGGVMNAETTAWWPNEPNQFKGSNEDCGCIIATRKNKFMLNDAPCSFSLQYICEVELN